MQMNSTTRAQSVHSGVAEWLSLPEVPFFPFGKSIPEMFRHSSLDQERTSSHEQDVLILLHLLHLKCFHLYQHSLRVHDLARQFAHHLSLPQKEISLIELAALLHDAGKMLLSADILQKAGKLTHREFEKVKQHSASGAQLLRGIHMPEKIISLVYHHHERWDGSGYPDKIAGTAIPEGARLITICDAFDAMTASRPYHSAWTPAQALVEVRRCAGTQFDPFLASQFCSMLLSEQIPALAGV